MIIIVLLTNKYNNGNSNTHDNTLHCYNKSHAQRGACIADRMTTRRGPRRDGSRCCKMTGSVGIAVSWDIQISACSTLQGGLLQGASTRGVYQGASIKGACFKELNGVDAVGYTPDTLPLCMSIGTRSGPGYIHPRLENATGLRRSCSERPPPDRRRRGMTARSTP